MTETCREMYLFTKSFGRSLCLQNKTKQNQPPNNKVWKTSESIAHSFLMLELRCVEVHANDDTLCHFKTKNVCPAKLYSRLRHEWGHLHC